MKGNRVKLDGVGAFFLLAAVAIGVSLATGSSDERPSAQPPLTPEERAAAPKSLQATLAQGNQLIDASIAPRLEGLRGVPVVVNQWASWCPSCRLEFPFFQQLSEELRDEVAFLGLDSQDDRGAAEDFLEQFPVNYPSIFDPSAGEAAAIGAGQSWPTTVFLDRRGEGTHGRPGRGGQLGQPRPALRR